MSWIRILLFSLLALYSIALIGLDFIWGQEFVKGFFSDVVTRANYKVGYAPLFAINTSISVMLLFGTAVLFAVCLGIKRLCLKSTLFHVSQLGFYLYLAADDRLRFHEWLGRCLGLKDAFVLFGIGMCQLAFLYFLGGVVKQSWRLKRHLIATAVFFCIMVFIDAFMPQEMDGRLAMEDISKLWAVFFLFLYAWYYCMDWVSENSMMHEKIKKSDDRAA